MELMRRSQSTIAAQACIGLPHAHHEDFNHLGHEWQIKVASENGLQGRSLLITFIAEEKQALQFSFPAWNDKGHTNDGGDVEIACQIAE